MSSPITYEIDKNVRFRIWRSAVAPSDAAEKTAIWVNTEQLQSSGAQQPQNSFGKFNSCWLLVRTKLSVPSHLWVPVAKFDNCCHRYSGMRKKLYRCTWRTQTFPSIFGLFGIFDRNFAEFMAPTSDESENYVQGRPKKPGPLCFTASNFRNIEKICNLASIKVILFLTLIRNLFESTLENKVSPSSEWQ